MLTSNLEKIGENVKVVDRSNVDKSNFATKVGLTGSISSGKSTTLRFFADCGAFTFNADQCVRQAYESDPQLIAEVVQLFGQDILSDGKINSEKLAQLVFSSEKKLKLLESVVHPYVFDIMKRAWQQAVVEEYSLFVAEVPLLFESKTPFADWFDTTILVQGSQPITDESKIRQKRFMPDEDKAVLCDYLLTNFGTLDELKSQVKNLYETLTT